VCILFGVQVLAESEQMRREADDIGPRAELEHWKKRMSKFNYLVDQIKCHEVKAVLGILHAAKSKLIKVEIHLSLSSFLFSPSCLSLRNLSFLLSCSCSRYFLYEIHFL
jgi:hypothetical protein